MHTRPRSLQKQKHLQKQKVGCWLGDLAGLEESGNIKTKITKNHLGVKLGWINKNKNDALR